MEKTKEQLIKEWQDKLDGYNMAREDIQRQLEQLNEDRVDLNTAAYAATNELLLLESPLYDNPVFIKWARALFAKCSLSSTKAALKYADIPNLEVIIERDNIRRNKEWVIAPKSNPEFCLEAFENKEEALAFRKAMGWILLERGWVVKEI